MTVAVSIVSGVAALTSAAPALDDHAVGISVACEAALAWLNLRGVRESGRYFAVPTYAFIATVHLMFAVAAVRIATGSTIRAESADLPVHAASSYAGLALVLLAMRAFASGCTALTGVEAISSDRRLRRQPHPPDPGLHHRSLRLLHPVPGGHGQALAARTRHPSRRHPSRRATPAGAAEVAVPADARPRPLSENHVMVLVASINAPSLRALSYAKTLRPTSLTAVTVSEDPAEAEVLRATWDAHGIDVPLRVLSSPYRSIVQPVPRHIRDAPERTEDSVVSVVIPEYVVGHWWEQPLHNQSALRLKARLLFMKNVVVIDVPYRLASAREPAAERAEAPQRPRT